MPGFSCRATDYATSCMHLKPSPLTLCTNMTGTVSYKLGWGTDNPLAIREHVPLAYDRVFIRRPPWGT